MKKSFLYPISLSLLLLGACSSDEVTDAPSDAPTEQPNPPSTPGENEAFSFTHFKIDVKYDQNSNFEVDYENESSGVEAKIEDDLNNETFNGDDAYKQLEPIFKNFAFTSSSTDEETISEIMSAFKLPDNYNEIEVEIHFTDGKKKDFTMTK